MTVKKYYNLGKNILFPICRSITGKGTLKTLKLIKKEFKDLKIKKIKSGEKVFDWVIPPEWNIKEAYIVDKNGVKIVDFKNNNLHIIGYSIKVNRIIKKKDLIKNLFYLKEQPDAIPYITSYYKKRWGFCLTYNQFKEINIKYSDEDAFKVVINSNLNNNGSLNYGELIIKGKSRKEILISTYICHPSMANNELSGPIVSMSLINYFIGKKLNKTLRFIFIPETIGSIAYLSRNLKYLKRYVIGGYNLSCVGDERKHSCMLSKNENSPSDEALLLSYKKMNIRNYKIYPFLNRGSDERQYNSPGIDLGITSIFRSKYTEYPEYHTSLDNFNVVTLKGLTGGYNVAKNSIKIIQNNTYPISKILCEPQMGKRGLYPTLSVKSKRKETKKFMDFLQYSDGFNSLNKISKLINLDIKSTKKIYKVLSKNNLLL